jgi:hypothetical protein
VKIPSQNIIKFQKHISISNFRRLPPISELLAAMPAASCSDQRDETSVLSMMTDLTGELMSVFGVVSIVLHDGHDAMRIDRLPGGESQVVSLASDPLNSVLPFEAGLWMDGWSDLSEAEIKRRILECRRVFRVALGVTVKLGGGRNREWWERLFIAGGFRRHPLSQLLTPYVELEQEQGDTTLVFERIPDTAVATGICTWTCFGNPVSDPTPTWRATSLPVVS